MSFHSFLSSKANDKEAHDEKGDLVNELQGIHNRKIIIQQKLEQFHHRQSMSFVKNG